MWWTGTDVLKFNIKWHYRLRMKVWMLFIDEHRTVSEYLARELPFETIVQSIKPAWIHYDNSLLRAKSKAQRNR